MLLVDTRAGSKELIAPLQRLGVAVEPSTLPAGDVEFVGRGVGGAPVLVGVEYKKWGDLLQCVRSGRFADQLREMKKSYEVCWLLIEGRVRQPKRNLEVYSGARWMEQPGRFTYQEAASWVLTMAGVGGVQVWRTESQEESVLWLRTLYLWWSSKEWEDHRAHTDFFIPPYGVGSTPLEEPTWVQRIASQLPGIGPEKAVQAAQIFRSPREMMNSDGAGWERIKGITPKKSSKLVGVCDGSVSR